MTWRNQVARMTCDVHAEVVGLRVAERNCRRYWCHLAWPGLPNYKERFHFEQTLPADYRF